MRYWCLLLVSSVVTADDIFTHEFEQNITTRVNTIEIKDPHIFAFLFNAVCFDVTTEVNNQLNARIGGDTDGDGVLDVNLLTQFYTDQPSYISSRPLQARLLDANCPEPLFSGACSATVTLADNLNTEVDAVDNCLLVEPGSTSAYVPAVLETAAPCYVTHAADVVLDLGGIQLPLMAYQQASRYPGALVMDQGLHKGFVTEAAAESTVIPADIPQIGGQTLAALLPGGLDNCAATDDRDVGPDGMTMGWWFYFNSASDLIELQ